MMEFLKHIEWGSFFGGAFGVMLLSRVGEWLLGLLGKASPWVVSQIKNLEAKVDQTGVGAQLQADNAVFDALEKAIPELIAVLPGEVSKRLEDGKITTEEWKTLAAGLWEAAKPQLEGGLHDYLKKSSFDDGKAVALMVLRRFTGKKKAGDK